MWKFKAPVSIVFFKEEKTDVHIGEMLELVK